jgi:acetyl esterase/lipase
MIPALLRPLAHDNLRDQQFPSRNLRAPLIILCAMCLLPVVGAETSSLPVVQIASGKVRGFYSGKLMIFKGIPYAASPVGNLRWHPPQPVTPWNGVRATTEYGHDCMQILVPNDDAPLRTKPSEDCLYLNVWAPRDHGTSLLPVMIWIYGGGFVIGGSSPEVYDGSLFAEKGVVFVSFNYRLNRFGFFAFPALLKEPGPYGCYEIMDQIAALTWVQRNIAAFGGNPHEVTIFGQSAGGISVSMLLSSPEAKGLFARAIIDPAAAVPVVWEKSRWTIPARMTDPRPCKSESTSPVARALTVRVPRLWLPCAGCLRKRWSPVWPWSAREPHAAHARTPAPSSMASS